MLEVVPIIAASGSSGSSLTGLLFPVVLLAGLYLLLVRPQRARAKRLTQVQRSVEPGARVITTAGLHATVVSSEGDTVVLEIAPGVHATFAAQAVVRVLPDPDEHGVEALDAAPDDAGAPLPPAVDLDERHRDDDAGRA
jgi:preprotein translocase subunit YajC